MDKRFLRSPKVWRVAPPLMMPTSSAHENNGTYLRGSPGPSRISDENPFDLPKLIQYDTLEKKSAQQLLYEVYRKGFFPYNLT
jgi:hypothetical protein